MGNVVTSRSNITEDAVSWMSSNCKAKSYVHQIADCEFNVSNGCDGFHGVCENIGNQVTSCSVAQAAAAVQQAYGNADASIQDGFLAGIDNTAKSETDITNIVQHYLESQCGAESDMSQTLHATVNCSNSKNDIMTFLNHADQSTSCYISAISQVNQSAVALSSSHLTGFGIGLIVFAVIIVVGIITRHHQTSQTVKSQGYDFFVIRSLPSANGVDCIDAIIVSCNDCIDVIAGFNANSVCSYACANACACACSCDCACGYACACACACACGCACACACACGCAHASACGYGESKAFV